MLRTIIRIGDEEHKQSFDYNSIIIKIEDKCKGKTLKELLVKEGNDSLLYQRIQKEVEIVNMTTIIFNSIFNDKKQNQKIQTYILFLISS